MQQELDALSKALEKPKRPVMAVIGGAKISTKLELLGNLIEKVDVMILGGGMANTFLAARDTPMGKSLCEHDMLDTAREIMAKAEAADCEILLPIDGAIAKEFKEGVDPVTAPVEMIPEDGMMLDIGPISAEMFEDRLAECRTLLWNGPLGAFELEPFDGGTTELAIAAAEMTKEGRLLSVAGAATRWRRWPMLACSASSATFRRRAAPFWSGSKARSCRAWRRCARSDDGGRLFGAFADLA